MGHPEKKQKHKDDVFAETTDARHPQVGFKLINGTMTPDSMDDTQASRGSSSDIDEDITENSPSLGSCASNSEKKHGYLIALSAKSESSLRHLCESLQGWVSKTAVTDEQVRDLSYTLCVRRSIFNWRRSLTIRGPHELKDELSKTNFSNAKSLGKPGAIFVFTGQGAQWIGMGRELLLVDSAFRNSLKRSDMRLQALGAEYSLIDELCKAEKDSHLNESWIAQPATTALQIALVDVLASIGIRPTAALGHSSGEIAAAYASGALSQSAALAVSYHRSSLSSIASNITENRGAMLATALSSDAAASYIGKLQKGRVCVACINSPSSSTLSGDSEAIQECKQLLDNDSISNRLLRVDTAYHSHHMNHVADIYRESMNGLESHDSEICFLSSVSGKVKRTGFGANYWVENLVSPVQFSDAVSELVKMDSLAASASIIIEIGPHNALQGPIRQVLTSSKVEKFGYIPTLLRNQNALDCLLEVAGKLFEKGHSVNLRSTRSLTGPESSCRLLQNLPPYPWDRSKRFWHESILSREYRFRKEPYHDLLGIRIVGTPTSNPIWRHIISLETNPWLKDHVVEDSIVFPASGYLCMAVEALRQVAREREVRGDPHRFLLRDVSFSKALGIAESSGKIEAFLTFKALGNSNDKHLIGWEEFQVSTRSPNGAWFEHCSGRIALELRASDNEVEYGMDSHWLLRSQIESFDRVERCCSNAPAVPDVYSEINEAGNVYGPTFTMMENLRINGSSAFAQVRTPDIAAIMPYHHLEDHIVHPTTLDSIFHIGLPLFFRSCTKGSVMPVRIEEIIVSSENVNTPGTTYDVACALTSTASRSAIAELIAVQQGPDGNRKSSIIIRGSELRSLGELWSGDDPAHESDNMTFRLQWSEDVSINLVQELTDIKESGKTMSGNLTLDEKDVWLHQVAATYMHSTIQELTKQCLPVPTWYHQELVAWIKDYLLTESCKALIQDSGLSELAASNVRGQSLGVEGEAITRVGEVLVRILTGELEPLAVLLQDDLLYRLYSDESSRECSHHLQKYIKHLAFKKPYLRVLEIGAGTGGTTLTLLQAHTEDSNLHFSSYDYTDVSSGFFEHARAKFAEWTDILRFDVLDIERDPILQGFEESSYDLIIAANVIHTTRHLDQSLEHIRRLLKPGGQLALLEMVKMIPPIMMIFGLLPGWWAGKFDMIPLA